LFIDGKTRGVKLSLTNSNDVLTQLWGGLHKHSRKYLHDGCSEALNQSWAVGCVTLSSTEALTLKDSDALSDGLFLLHELGDAGHDVGAVVAGPVPEHALHLAEAELSARITSSDESGVEAVGHVRPPHGKTRLTSSGICSLRANLGDEDSHLLRNRLLRSQPLQESGSSSIALVTGGSQTSRGEGDSGGSGFPWWGILLIVAGAVGAGLLGYFFFCNDSSSPKKKKKQQKKTSKRGVDATPSSVASMDIEQRVVAESQPLMTNASGVAQSTAPSNAFGTALAAAAPVATAGSYPIPQGGASYVAQPNMMQPQYMQYQGAVLR